MLKSYTLTLYNTILNNSLLLVFVIFLFILACIVLIFIIILGLLDSIYRPNIAQYPFNLFIDKICPLIIIISPTIIIFYLSPIILSLLEKSIIIIIIQLCICIPLMYLWSKTRNWEEDNASYKIYWNSPLLYLNLQIIILYISCFFFLISVLRYLRLGTDILVYPNFILDILQNPLIFSLTMTPFTIGWLIVLINKVSNLRKKCWLNVVDFIHSIHIKLLRYYLYFKFMELFYKICFIWFTFIINENIIYVKRNFRFFRKILHYAYIKAWYINIIIFIIILLEIYYRDFHIYYSLYLLFYFFLLKNVFHVINKIALSHWAFDCCVSDYLNLNLENPKYPSCFWSYFSMIHEEYNLKINYSLNITKIIEEKTKYRYIYKKGNYKLISRILQNSVMSFPTRVKISYYNWSNIRWVHSSTLNKTFHPLTGLFARTYADKIILLNSSWHSTYSFIQKGESLFPKFIENNKNPIRDNKNYPFRDISEKYQLGFLNNSRLSELGALSWFTNVSTKINAHASPFLKNLFLDTKSQAQPDIVINLKGSVTVDQRIHGFDQKLKINVVDTNSQILCGSFMSKERYQIVLQDNFRTIQSNIIDLTPELVDTIFKIHQNLAEMYFDFDLQLEYLLHNIHHFQNKTGLSRYIPSLITKEPINISALHPQIQETIPKSMRRLELISKKLYEKNFAVSDYKIALELFSESFIQQLLLDN